MTKRLLSPALLSVAGLGFLSAAAWMVAMPLGLAVIGIALLLIEWRVDQS